MSGVLKKNYAARTFCVVIVHYLAFCFLYRTFQLNVCVLEQSNAYGNGMIIGSSPSLF